MHLAVCDVQVDLPVNQIHLWLVVVGALILSGGNSSTLWAPGQILWLAISHLVVLHPRVGDEDPHRWSRLWVHRWLSLDQ